MRVSGHRRNLLVMDLHSVVHRTQHIREIMGTDPCHDVKWMPVDQLRSYIDFARAILAVKQLLKELRLQSQPGAMQLEPCILNLDDDVPIEVPELVVLPGVYVQVPGLVPLRRQTGNWG